MEFVPDSWLVSSFVFSILWGVADVKTSLIGFTKPLYPGVFKAALLSKVKLSLKPRLHERFFACDGDAIFLKIVASPVRGENRVCSHPRTGDATDEKITEKKSREIQ